MTAETDLHAEVARLAYREAMLLDRRRWDDWIDMFTEDAVYSAR
ncbi:MAG: nuclear transport factor 2 family protein [Alphaproteobacteria bacterium]|nr:nuclear transport factor 2 family protein [Alphaproteobacteria bacterium]